MASRKMWMGPRGRERWVPAPASGMDSSPTGWSTSSTYLNGGTGRRNSFASHKEYDLTWNQGSRDALRPIVDMSSGMYGTGEIFFIDPMTMDKNVLPYQWSVPSLAAIDGPVLWGEKRPSTAPTASNSLDYPALSAQYSPAALRSSIYVPIPEGHTAWVGWHGSADATGGVQVTPVLPGNYRALAVPLRAIPVDSDTRVNTAFSGRTYRGIELRFGGGAATSVVIAGVMVQILPSTSTPQRGGFISGQGHSGCRFDDRPKLQSYSANVGIDGLVGLSAKLIETGDWAGGPVSFSPDEVPVRNAIASTSTFASTSLTVS